ncbi:A/G-specific adenine glycosylase [Jeotgalibacillus soli]|uniref:Adenine DNA glycosylase n=1 Tax=Jeotgalibacillus soli TaxID=889306 RepID=A0A0C2RAB0_9BACL|nr:A/G-specific adenine glycosylase [Jeotgalibacillus soli]KIL47250.1 DNA glycosylase [Jeotgalibacillus soli]
MSEKLNEQLEKVNKHKFQQDLIGWFENEMRDLPWRKDQDPYRIWVSEIMLQQTRVDTVIPFYNRFMGQFPTVEALANAPEEQVLKAWEGLGYYSRARNLHTAVKEVHECYGGKVPKTPEEIASLRGVGPYTAGAILSIAYDIPEPAVDGNVMRVFSRILSIWDDVAKPSSRKVFEEAVRRLIDENNPSYFNQALMELGALICTPTSPSCLLCPVNEHCLAFAEGVQSELPVKTRKKSTKVIDLLTVMVQNQEGQWLVTQRPSEGLLANLWQFPSVERQGHESVSRELEEFLLTDIGVTAEVYDEPWMKQDHVFSHLTWKMSVYYTDKLSVFDDAPILPERVAWKTADEIEGLALPISYRKIWRQHLIDNEKNDEIGEK